MTEPSTSRRTRMLEPDLYLRSVRDIDIEGLRERGIDTLLMDLDNTLLPRDSTVIPDDIVQWCSHLDEQGMTACLVSNNWHERVRTVAAELDFLLVSKAVKPLPMAFRRAMRLAGSSRDRSVVVGDQMFTDVLGGKLLGLMTIMVLPLSHSDLPHTLLLRRIERVLLAGRQPEP